MTPGSLYWNIHVGRSVSEASILLTWNAQYQDALGNFNNTLSLANMDLRLYDSTNGFLSNPLAASLSSVDNVEHIYLRNLNPGLSTIEVSSNMNTRYGLAWNFTAVPEPSSMMLWGAIGAALLAGHRFRLGKSRDTNTKRERGGHVI